MWVVVIVVIGRLWNDRIIRDCRISGTSALIRRKEAKRCEMDVGRKTPSSARLSISKSAIRCNTERNKCVIRNMDKENKLILYKDEEGRVSVNTRLRN